MSMLLSFFSNGDADLVRLQRTEPDLGFDTEPWTLVYIQFSSPILSNDCSYGIAKEEGGEGCGLLLFHLTGCKSAEEQCAACGLTALLLTSHLSLLFGGFNVSSEFPFS